MKKFNFKKSKINNKNFITFEGIEGSGKSTIAKQISNELKKELDKKINITREPGGSNINFSEDIRNIIMNNADIDKITELFLFESSRREHVVKYIKPLLLKNEVVICDRYADSTIIYQGYLKNIPIKTINQANNIATENIYPSLVLIFDIDPKISLKRITKENRVQNRFDKESIEFHEKARNKFLKLAKKYPKKYKVIDASKTIEEVLSDVKTIILKHLK